MLCPVELLAHMELLVGFEPTKMPELQSGVLIHLTTVANGTPGEIRTPAQPVRSRPLYSTELQAQIILLRIHLLHLGIPYHKSKSLKNLQARTSIPLLPQLFQN